MAAALGPVDASVGVTLGTGWDGYENAAIKKSFFSRRGKAVVDAASGNASFFDPTAGQEGVCEGYSGEAGEMRVAGAGTTEGGCRGGFRGRR